MSNSEDRFDFGVYERVKSSPSEAAQKRLNEMFPKGSDARAASRYVAAGGATCHFLVDRGYFYFCQYAMPGHGVMSLVSTIEWKIAIFTDSNGRVVDHIDVGRGATGL